MSASYVRVQMGDTSENCAKHGYEQLFSISQYQGNPVHIIPNAV